ncbi:MULTISPECIES: alpha/beta family hydrolase [unclassified Rhizobium]|uniref:alpha/beta family hydrolase n=1 Tax=unclassified Rhizobium TaxID=2613769 RepID=UPI000EA8BAE1|nr:MULTISPECIES: alpha/beta family hydrolase [unclassified Rhizobium]AYG68981.1 alpha/beta fold hydrolase [Rhizobium sp. CCGE531]AYG75366.1 alpha/beta fold hydrolase [Rhizobium sp. CCGE532]
MPHQFLVNGPEDAKVTIVLAHGAGGAMDTKWMEAMSAELVHKGLRIIRFEFDYMSARRSSGKRSPPPRAELLNEEFKTVIDEVDSRGALVIAGKSMGGRVASMIADDLLNAGRISGLLCLGYPFHPIGKPESLRTAHLAGLKTPALICQGTRDLFGSREEVSTYELSKMIELLWLEDGDHDFTPRKTVSGLTSAEHIATVADRVARWAATLR